MWNQKRVIELRKYLMDENKQDYPYKIPWRGDKPVPFDVYKVPIDVLNYNFQNTRLRAELESYLYKTGEKIEPEDKQQQKIVERILLNSEFIGEETDRLLRDLIKRGQLDPGVSAIDGTIIDGNRRLAIFHQLVKQGYDKFREMEICVLPTDATKTDLKELEMRIQMSHPFRVGYGNINTALEFRNLHRTLGWPLEKIERVTSGQYKKSRIERMITVIDLIDEYLKELPPAGKHEKEYTLVEKGWESFDNLYSYLNWSTKYSEPQRTLFRKRFGFQIISKKETTYNDIRQFGRILKDKNLREKLENESNTLRGKHASTYLDRRIVESEWSIFEKFKMSYKESQVDPKMIANQALKKLLSIKLGKIQRVDKELTEILNRIERRVQELKDRVR